MNFIGVYLINKQLEEIIMTIGLRNDSVRSVIKHKEELALRPQQNELGICISRMKQNIRRAQNALVSVSRNKKLFATFCKQNNISQTDAKKLIVKVNADELTVKKLCDLV